MDHLIEFYQSEEREKSSHRQRHFIIFEHTYTHRMTRTQQNGNTLTRFRKFCLPDYVEILVPLSPMFFFIYES